MTDKAQPTENESGNSELPPKPRRPRADECCKSDCSPCVFEIYDDELARWEKRVAEIKRRQEDGEGGTLPD